jgi:hypothetical protein
MGGLWYLKSEMKNTNKILLVTYQGTITRAKSKSKFKDNIKTDLRQVGC